ncbi:hypothetical protein [Pseudomonas putida]|nr:hypothetical protein [Pseudomonas putida]
MLDSKRIKEQEPMKFGERQRPPSLSRPQPIDHLLKPDRRDAANDQFSR